jgi:hypothetical protein
MGKKTPCHQTYGLAPESGAEKGLFSHQVPVVNTKMEPFCPPRKLSPRFVAKIQNRPNYGALYFPFSGVLEGAFYWSNLVFVWYPIRTPEDIVGQNPDWGYAGKFEVIDPI